MLTSIGRVGVLICYEAIFPAEARELFRAGAEVLVTITNDAWFGRSAAPVQHLAMAALRAVEGRAFLLRAANTGISALVAPDGRIVEASGLFTPQVLFGSIAPRSGMSPYTRYGDLFAWATVAVSVAASWPVLLGRRVRIQAGVRPRALHWTDREGGMAAPRARPGPPAPQSHVPE